MIEFGAADFIPLERFPLAVRFTDPRHDVLPADSLADLRPLAPARAAALGPALTAACAEYRVGVSAGAAEIAAECPDDDAAARVARDLAALAVADGERVVVSWDAATALETSWRTFRTYWDDFCYPSSDDVTVYPTDGGWVLCYYHWERFTFNPAPPAP